MTENNNCKDCSEKDKKIQGLQMYLKEMMLRFDEVAEIAQNAQKMCKCFGICFPTTKILSVFNGQLKEYKGAE